MQKWQGYLRWLLIVLGIATVIVVLYTVWVVIAGYATGVFPEPDWTGFGTPKLTADQQAIPQFKTLWDWLDLLLVPLVLAIGGFFLNRSENRYALKLQERREAEARKIEEQRIQEAHNLEEQRAQEAGLNAYLDQMTQLLLDNNNKLRASKAGDEVRSVARARTLTVLRVLDGARKATVLQFLYEAKLITAYEGNDIDIEVELKPAIVSLV